MYRISATPVRTGAGGSRYVGSSPAVAVVWNATRHLSVLTNYLPLFPGPYFQASPPGKATDYFTVWLDYKF